MSDPFNTPLQPQTPPVPLDPTPPKPNVAPTSPTPASGMFGDVQQAQSPLESLGSFLQNGLGAGTNIAIAPIKTAVDVLTHIPTSFLPGGADEHFEQIGKTLQTSGDTAGYNQWLAAKAKAEADPFEGARIKGSYNQEFSEQLDEASKDGFIGINPELQRLGSGSYGTLGDAMIGTVFGALNAQASAVQRGIAGSQVGGAVEGYIQALEGIATAVGTGGLARPQSLGLPEVPDALKAAAANIGRTRVEALRAEDPSQLQPIEQKALQLAAENGWTDDHIHDYLVRNNASYSADFATQMLGAIATDPLTIETIGAGAISKAGLTTGKALLDVGREGDTIAQKAAVLIAKAQQGPGGPAFRYARGIIDPFATMGQSTATEGVIDMTNANTVEALERAYGPGTRQDIYRMASQHGFVGELQRAEGGYIANLTRLHSTITERDTNLASNLGESLIHVSPEDVVDVGVRAGPKDALTQLTEFAQKRAKNVFTQQDLDQLAARAAAWVGRSKGEWMADLRGASRDLQSYVHALSYNGAERQYYEALNAVDLTQYAGDLPLGKMVLLNDHNLDNISAKQLIEAIDAAPTGLEKASIWNDAVGRYSAVSDLGRSGGGEFETTALRDRLQEMLDNGELHTRVEYHELNDAALRPVRDFLNRHTVEGQPLWHLGFRPDEEVAWAMRRHPVTGKWMATGDPTISHVQDAVPAALPFSQTTRNVLGQVIGKQAAGAASRPVESIEAFLKTMADAVSSRRVATDIEQRFEAAAVEKLGLSRQQAAEISKAAREVSAFEKTTLKGISGDNLWEKTEALIPEEMRGFGPGKINRHNLLGELVNAAGGDLRIVGTGSKFTQTQRNIIRRLGDHANWAGQVSQTLYSRLRYFHPTFFIQRVTDGPFYTALRGAMPVGKTLYDPALKEQAIVMRNMGRTGFGRDLAVDLPEYVPRSQFGQSIWDNVVSKVGNEGRLESIRQTGDLVIRNSMTKLTYEGMGDVLNESLDEVRTVIKSMEKDNPELAAEMLGELDNFEQHSVAGIRQQFLESTGRVLDDKELGLKYVQQQFSSQARARIRDDNTLDLSRILSEGDLMSPGDVGELRPVPLDDIAYDLNYVNEAGLRAKVAENGITWLKETLQKEYGVHPDQWRRIESAMRMEWRPFWEKTATDLALSSDIVTEMQNVVAREAQAHGMDPHVYLSQIMDFNIGPNGMNGQMAKLANYLKAGREGGLAEAVAAFRGNIDLSQQRTLVEHWQTELPSLAAEARAAGDTERAAQLDDIAATLDRGANPPPPPAPPASQALLDTSLDILPPGQRSAIAAEVDRFGEMFPDIQMPKIRIDPEFHEFNPRDAQAGTDPETLEITLSPDYYDSTGAAMKWGQAEGENNLRWNIDARPTVVSTTPEGAVRHELGHVIDERMRDLHYRVDPLLSAEEQRALYDSRKAYRNFIEDFYYNGGANELSYYAGRPVETGNLPGQEAAGELFDLAFGPADAREAFFKRMVKERKRLGADPSYVEQLKEDVQRYRQFVEETELYRPRPVDPRTADYNAAFDAAFADNIARRAAGEAIDNPEIEGAVQNFSRWAQQSLVAHPEVLGGELRDIVASIPTDAAFRYNHTQALIQRLLKQKMGLLESDAFRLAEMQATRTVFERSLNHPVFGIYPASYMWGKVLPEALRFFARNPYAATYQIIDAERAIAIQREWDPDFRDAQGTLDGSEMAFAAGYLTPSLPWEDMAARAPAWLQAFGKYGLDPGKIAEAQLATMSPTRWYSFLTNPAAEALQFAQSFGGQQGQSTVPDMFGGTGLDQAPTGGAEPSQPPDLSGTVTGSNLQPVLSQDMQDLEALFR